MDEAAAIPLPHVRKLIGPYLVFLSSTVNGYEGTGRALSLKLIQQLRAKSGGGAAASADATKAAGATGAAAGGGGGDGDGGLGGRSLHEVTLSEPIRYAKADPIEVIKPT